MYAVLMVLPVGGEELGQLPRMGVLVHRKAVEQRGCLNYGADVEHRGGRTFVR